MYETVQHFENIAAYLPVYSIIVLNDLDTQKYYKLCSEKQIIGTTALPIRRFIYANTIDARVWTVITRLWRIDRYSVAFISNFFVALLCQ